MSKDQELIDNYLASGGTIKKFSEAEEVNTPYTGPKVTTEPSMEYDRNGNRLYRYLNKICIGASLDETRLNYGK